MSKAYAVVGAVAVGLVVLASSVFVMPRHGSVEPMDVSVELVSPSPEAGAVEEAVAEAEEVASEAVELRAEGEDVVEPDVSEITREAGQMDDGVAEVEVEEEDAVILGSGVWIPRLQFPPVLEEMIVKSTVIARVRLSSVEVAGVKTQLWPIANVPDHPPYNGALKFMLDVRQCIKGSCGSQLVAYAYGVEDWGGMYENEDFAAETVEDAKAKASQLLVNRDGRWDDRDALVMLRYNARDEHYYLGVVSADGYVQFTVAGPLWRSWLPDAEAPAATSTPPVGARGAQPGAPQRFLLQDTERFNAQPVGTKSAVGGRVAAAARAVETISLRDFEAKVTALEREYNGGDGTVAWKECIVRKYEWESQSLREMEENGGEPVRAVYRYESPSGLPAGALIRALPYSDEKRERYGDTPPPTYGNYWTEGRDRELLVGGWPGEIRTSRPLIMGEYRVFELWRSADRHKCDAYPERERERFEHVVTVTAPAGTLAESFFDPYASSTAIIGTTTVGMISWHPPSLGSGQAGRVTADLTVDATGHALDFIGLDGTTTLSLIVADATETDGTLSWTVPTQPWSAGDKLMLRVRRHDAPTPTPTPTPTATPTPTPAPAPTSTPTPIPTDRPVILFLDSLDASVLDSLEMAVGEVFWVSVKALNLESSDSYTIEVSRVNDEPAGGVGIVFHYQACGYTPQSIRVSSGNTSYARTMAVKLCTGTGGTVTAVLKRGNTTLATTELEVSLPP